MHASPGGRRAARAGRAVPGLGGVRRREVRRGQRRPLAGRRAAARARRRRGRGAAARDRRADRRGSGRLQPRADRARARRQGHLRRGVPLSTCRLSERGGRADRGRRRHARVRDDAASTTPRRASSAPTGPPSAATPSWTGWPRRWAAPAPSRGWRATWPGRGAQVKVTGAYYLTGARAHRLRHDPGARRARHDLRPGLQGRAGRSRPCGLAGRDPRRQGRPEDRRLPGEPQPAAVRRRAGRRRSRGSRSRPTTSAARTAPRSARSTAASSST